jgi:hypothetical protein
VHGGGSSATTTVSPTYYPIPAVHARDATGPERRALRDSFDYRPVLVHGQVGGPRARARAFRVEASTEAPHQGTPRVATLVRQTTNANIVCGASSSDHAGAQDARLCVCGRLQSGGACGARDAPRPLAPPSSDGGVARAAGDDSPAERAAA